MRQIYDRTAARFLISIGINKDLVKKAEKLNIDLAHELEQLIIQKLESEERAEWMSTNSSILEKLKKIA